MNALCVRNKIPNTHFYFPSARLLSLSLFLPVSVFNPPLSSGVSLYSCAPSSENICFISQPVKLRWFLLIFIYLYRISFMFSDDKLTTEDTPTSRPRIAVPLRSFRTLIQHLKVLLCAARPTGIFNPNTLWRRCHEATHKRKDKHWKPDSCSVNTFLKCHN